MPAHKGHMSGSAKAEAHVTRVAIYNYYMER